MKRALVTDRSGGPAVEVGPDATVSSQGAIVLPGLAKAAGAGSSGTNGASSRVRVEVVVDGWRFEFDVEDADRAALRAKATAGHGAHTQHGPTEVRTIIPGRILAIAVTPGDVVTIGQQLLTVEAMKMQNEIRSPRDGTVERVAVGPGATVELGDLLLVLA